jgi:lipid A 3-O-deacylase
VDDRPYAGWLYATGTLQRRGRMARGLPVMESLRLDAGVIGPESLAEETQKSWHGTAPQGWDNQLKTEPGINLRYDRSVLLAFRSRETPWGGDIIPFFQVSAGNVHSFVGVGSTFRFGYNVPNEFEALHEKQPGKWGAYLFTTAEGRWVWRNIFLDGNTFRDSHSVDKRPLVGDVKVGLTLVLKNVELSAAHTLVSQEFKGQKSLDTYGTAVITVKF